MNNCKICNDQPKEIFIGFLAKQGLKICKSCMKKYADSHVIIDNEDNFIASDYFNLIDNKDKPIYSKDIKVNVDRLQKLGIIKEGA